MKLLDEEYEVLMYALDVTEFTHGDTYLFKAHKHTVREHVHNMLGNLKKEREQTGEVNVI